MIEKLAQTEHGYHCSLSNGFTGNDPESFETWEDFCADWADASDHLNLLFRFDINQKVDENDEDIIGDYQLDLFFVLQRKGIFKPVLVEHITEADLPEINEYLASKWDYLSDMWKEFKEVQV